MSEEPVRETSHREDRPRRPVRPGRAGLVAFVLSAVGVAGVGLLVLNTFTGPAQSTLDSVGAVADKRAASPTTGASTNGSAGASATPRTTASTPPAAGRAPRSLGTVKGVYTLHGPRTAAPGSWAMFVLSGPKRVVRADGSAPFAVKVNTRTVPNGKYTLTVVVMRAGAPAKVGTRVLRVLNPKKASTKPTAAPTTTTTPTTTPSPGAGSGTGSGTGAGNGAGSSVAAQVVSLTNAERAKNGCKALSVNSALTTAAQAHSADMAAKNYFSHDSQDGRSPFDRMKAAGYSYRMAAENIAMGQRSAQDVMTAWMNSSGHKANILNCGLTQIGVGYALNSSGTPYWTQDFGTPS